MVILLVCSIVMCASVVRKNARSPRKSNSIATSKTRITIYCFEIITFSNSKTKLKHRQNQKQQCYQTKNIKNRPINISPFQNIKQSHKTIPEIKKNVQTQNIQRQNQKFNHENRPMLPERERAKLLASEGTRGRPVIRVSGLNPATSRFNRRPTVDAHSILFSRRVRSPSAAERVPDRTPVSPRKVSEGAR